MKKAAIFFAEGFEEVEGLTQVDLLRRAGIDAQMISITDEKEVAGSHGIKIICDKTINEFNEEEFDAIILPGGMPGTLNLGNCQKLCDSILKFNEEGKILGAICAAPSVFGTLGILKGKKACCYPGFEEKLLGADVSFENVETSGSIITSRGVGTAIDFALALITALVSDKKANEVKESIIYK